jgi:glucan phosphoethanolaminetransferase (alkaline phosphatase superfamily)
MKKYGIKILVLFALFLPVFILCFEYIFAGSDYFRYFFYMSTLYVVLAGIFFKRVKFLSFIFLSFFLFLSSVATIVTVSTGFRLDIAAPEIISIVGDTNYNEVATTLKNLHFFQIIPTLSIGVLALFMSVTKDDLPTDRERNNWMLIAVFVAIFLLGRTHSLVFSRMAENISHSYAMIKESRKNQSEKEKFFWNSKSEIKGNSTVVIILGETTRGDHFSINGYPRETNPLLSKEDLITFKDVVANGPRTLISTPYILTRKPVTKEYIYKLWPEKSIFSAYKEAGYVTYYISYLSQIHAGDNSLNQILAEADHYIRRDLCDGFDYCAVNEIKKILDKDRSPKKLIILKLNGSHYNFEDRYPESFDYFQPSLQTIRKTDLTPADRNTIINTYDNTIRYTDYVTDNVIGLLKQEKGDALMSFISDHGTAIYEDGKTLYSGNTKSVYNIPLFFWFNDVSKQRLQSELPVLESNTNKKIDSKYFLDTMFDLSGISTDKRYGETLVKEIKGDGKRFVVSGDKVVNFETLP